MLRVPWCNVYLCIEIVNHHGPRSMTDKTNRRPNNTTAVKNRGMIAAMTQVGKAVSLTRL